MAERKREKARSRRLKPGRTRLSAPPLARWRASSESAEAEPATARATRSPLPEGTLSVGAGLLVNGLTTYIFLSVARRALTEESYTPLGVLWAVVFLIGPGFFLPIEQEVSRALADRRARGFGGAPVVRRALILAAGLLGALLVLAAVTSSLLVEHLFDEQALLLAGLALSICGQAAGHLARGVCSGQARFRPYAVFLGGDGIFRLLGALVLVIVGVETAGWFGLALGIAPILAVTVAMSRQRGLLSPGPEAPWRELTTALAALLAGSILSFTLVNGGPIAVQLLATETEKAEAGRFLNGLIVARVPLFLFQAVQAALLPRLSALAGAGRLDDFRVGLRRLVLVTVGIAAAATAGGFALGPPIVQRVFDEELALSHRTLGLLALASGLYMIALALAQAVIALGGHRLVAAAWASGVAAFVVGTAFFADELLLRVELGLVAGSALSVVAMAIALASRLRGGSQLESGAVIEALHDIALEP
ncbi:MAG: hypothetical protein ACRD0G_05685 [Acidimicrobiales bacterium]